MEDVKAKLPETQISQMFGVQQKSKLEDLKHGKEIETHYSKLNDYIKDMDDIIKRKVKNSEDDFFRAYKDQMHEIQKELRSMKKKIDEETLKQKADEKKRILEEERDYFREEALRLDRVSTEQLRTIEELKFKLKITNEEKNYYEGFVIDSKKENKALKYELLQLYKQKMDDQRKQAVSGGPGERIVGTLLNQKNFFASLPPSSRGRPLTQGETGTVSVEQPIESVEPEDITNKQKFNKPSTSSGVFTTQIEQSYKLRGLSSQQKSRVVNKELLDQLQNTIEQLKEQDSENQELIKQLRMQLQNEKQMIKKIKVDNSQTNSLRSDLEYILLECVNEVKKDIVRRRLQQKQQLHGKNLHEILQEQEIDFTKFSSQDKKKLLKLFIMSDEFLNAIYHTTFNPTFATASVIKLNEQWKKDAGEAQKKYNQFKNFRFYQIASQPVIKQVINKKEQGVDYVNYLKKQANTRIPVEQD